ncbi:MAG TPA: helicase-related protein [Fimbriimonadales bacterium]|nr:helicase-related protein [Fimbriimonadales bacterium]
MQIEQGLLETLQTLIDNRAGNQMLEAVRRLMRESIALDLATGYLELGAMLALDGDWQKLNSIRLLMGDEVTRKTKEVIVQALKERDLNGIEQAKEEDDWKTLDGLEAIKAALQNGTIDARVYTRAKFHAKALHFKTGGVVNHGIIGSSNFTRKGLTENLELNLFTSDNAQLKELEQWFQKAWEEAEDIKPELLKIIEPHIRLYSPFEIYLQAMREYFFGQAPPETTWETSESRVYHILATYQRDAYHTLRKIASTWGGALLCDGVGLGKTYVALALIERALKDGKRVMVLVPKSTQDSLWEPILQQYFPNDYHSDKNLPRNIVLIPHTDLGREGGIKEEHIEAYRAAFQTIVVDEAHHFRVPFRNRSRRLRKLAKDKEIYLLTATPINNSIFDLYWLMQYFVQDNQRRFETLGVPRLRDWFRACEAKILNEKTTPDGFIEHEEFLRNVLVLRSRKFVKELEKAQDARTIFPKRQPPRLIEYSLYKVYAQLLPEFMKAAETDKGSLHLALYETERFKTQQSKETLQKQSNIVGLIRTTLLKRLESSYKAFEASLEDLLLKHVQALEYLDEDAYKAWRGAQEDIVAAVINHRRERYASEEDKEDEEENELPPLTERREQELEELKKAVDAFGANRGEWFKQILEDMDILCQNLRGIYSNLSPDNDDKLLALIKEILNNPLLRENKFIIFTEFKDTARYLERELKKRLPDMKQRIIEVDSGRNVNNRSQIIKRFAPYYNCSQEELEEYLKHPLQILISTDVLSEGLNLQDANIVVNYDLHWNPVRLMQRIGRIDRRMDASKLVHDKAWIFNFLPPRELEKLISLARRLQDRLKIITMVLGLESPVLTPDDYVHTIDLWMEHGEGKLTVDDELRLIAAELERDYNLEWEKTKQFPNRIYSGKKGKPKGVFFAYRFKIPKSLPDGTIAENEYDWRVRWYFWDLENDKLIEDKKEIHNAIESLPDESRIVQLPREERTRIRKIVEEEGVSRDKFIMQLPSNLKTELICWMEVG